MKTLLLSLLLLFSLSAQDFRQINPKVWEESTINSAIKNFYGSSLTLRDNRIVIRAPSIASNGGAVPVTITSAIQAKTVSVFQDSNPKSATIIFDIHPEMIIDYSFKIKLKQTGNIKVVIEGINGNLYSSSIYVEVAVGGCDGGGSSVYPSSPAPLAPRRMRAKSIGLAVGGAKDSDNFYENIKNNYTPKLSSLTYEGTFYDHYFNIGIQKKCRSLFCPTFTKAIAEDIFNGEKNYYLSVGLNSGITNFKRKKLNLMVVLDVSGSMSSMFKQYAYDKKIPYKKKKSKMKLANEAIVGMIKHLKKEDRLAVVLFDSQAYLAKPFRKIKNTNIEATKKHILAIKTKGSTNWKAGYNKGISLFNDLPFEEAYENRIIFLTDAMPNRGELSKGGLFDMVKKASHKKIYTTFIGIGVDFNSDLVEIVTKTVGANYYSVHSSQSFKKRLDEEFEFMVTPLVFDMKLRIESEGYSIDTVYGSPKAKQATGEIMTIPTLFPSSKREGKVKGGIVLVKLKKHSNQKDIRLILDYKDRNQKKYHTVQHIKFAQQEPFYSNSGIQKAILLVNYVDLMKNWMLDSRVGCNSNVAKTWYSRTYGLRSVTKREAYSSISQWEKKSCPLKVSNGYKKILSLFRRAFIYQKRQLEDESLKKELNALKLLIGKKQNKRDDWML